MPGVPDNVLSWLHGVLRNDYRDVNRTYNDIAQVLSAHPSLRPRTEIYTYENGVSALLVLLSGTIPVNFRNQQYQFPIHVWIPHAYPHQQPICYVVPVESMTVRPNQFVGGDGRVYHPFLVQFSQGRSTLVDLIRILQDVFAKEPPVVSKGQAGASQPLPPPKPRDEARATPPPPLPAPPDVLRQHMTPVRDMRPAPQNTQQDRVPPPLPPKGLDGTSSNHVSPINGRVSLPNQAPPLPALPSTQPYQQRPSSLNYEQQRRYDAPPQQPHQVSRQSSLRYEATAAYTPNTVLPAQMRTHEIETRLTSPNAAPSLQQEYRREAPPRYDHPPPPLQPPQMLQQDAGYQQPYHGSNQAPFIAQQSNPTYQAPPYQGPPPPQQRKQRPPPQVDLLSSPLDVQLPGQAGNTEPLIVPPVPPNPEKDALLHALSQALVSQASRTISNNTTAYQALSAQHQALLTAQQTLQVELDSLAQLSSVLDANDSALRQGIAQIESSIASASSQRRPEIDTIIISPTVVGQQVYNAVAEEIASRDVRVALGKALEKGRIGPKDYVKEMRNVGREEFLRKAVVRKAAQGLGFEAAEVQDDG